MDDLISRTWLLAEYDKRHKGPSGGARKLIEEAPSALGTNLAEVSTNLAEVSTDLISRQDAIDTIEEYFARIGKLKRRGLNKGEKAIALDTVGAIKSLPSAQPDTYWKEQCQSYEQTINKLRESLSTQPEIIRCRECKFASGDSRICMKFDHSPIGELDFCSFAERREVNNESY